MRGMPLTRLAAAGLVGLGLTLPELAFAGPPPVGLANSSEAVNPLVVEVKKWKGKNWKGKNWKPNKHIYVGPRGGVYVRTWRRRPYYGNIIAGVALGTILGVAIAGSAPPPPASNLCWYWTDPSRTRGYWDYCY